MAGVQLTLMGRSPYVGTACSGGHQCPQGEQPVVLCLQGAAPWGAASHHAPRGVVRCRRQHGELTRMAHTDRSHTDGSHRQLTPTSHTDGSHGQRLAPPPPPPRPQMARAGAAPSPAEHQPRACASTGAPEGRGLCTGSVPAPGRAGQAAAVCRPHHQGSPGASSKALVAVWPRRPAVIPSCNKAACLPGAEAAPLLVRGLADGTPWHGA